MKTSIALLLSICLLCIAELKGGIINVRDFGATGNGVADDTSALQTAINFASTNKGSVFLPAGDYRVTDTLYAANVSLVIFGEGEALSRITLSANGKDLLRFIQTSSGAPPPAENPRERTLVLRDFAFVTDGLENTALRVEYPDPQSTHKNRSVVANRIRTGMKSGYWAYGFVLSNAWNSDFTECFFANWEGQFRGAAVLFAERSVNVRFVACSFSWWTFGVKITPV